MLTFLKRNIFIVFIFIFTLTVSFVTFLTFIDKSFIVLNEKNLNYLLISNIVILLILWFLNNLFNPETVRSPFGIRTSTQLYFLLLLLMQAHILLFHDH